MTHNPFRTAGSALTSVAIDIAEAGGALLALCPLGSRGPLVSAAVLDAYIDSARDDLNRTLAALDQAQSRKTRHQPTIDAALVRVNALSGAFDENDPEARGFDRGIRMAMAAIEGMSAEPAAVADLHAAPPTFQHAGDVASRVVEPFTKRYPDGESKYSVRPARDAAE